MADMLLEVKDIHAEVEGKEILKGLNLEIKKGEIHVIMGPNGAGKSTLVNIIMGHPKYEVTKGSVVFQGEDISDLKTEERAKKGIFLSFQTPEEVPGITVESFLRASKSAITGKPVKIMAFKRDLREKMAELKMDESYGSRYLNVGFSGGEKKKNEILQMMMLNPKLAILDETDSGLDVDAVKIVSNGVRQFKNEDNAILIITHNSKILESLDVDYVHVIQDGKVLKVGDDSLVAEINEQGFENIASV
jgi:Fe-S cluster assembly ATP-binding protein